MRFDIVIFRKSDRLVHGFAAFNAKSDEPKPLIAPGFRSRKVRAGAYEIGDELPNDYRSKTVDEGERLPENADAE